ncbi:MAG: ABC transporter ATP-binding protein, partial [Gammaproteobacteria bacterium]|nr:ABC transporter ATP-binding protein [Gammaproteobacteria bacterium]
TVLEVVMMGRSPHMGLFKSPTRHDEAIADSMLDQLNISHLRDEIYTRVSGGERQLTLIARALAQEPRILIMDEPTANLDFGNQIKVLARIKNLSRQGISIALSTHDPDHAFQCADRVAMLKGGRIMAVGTPTEILTSTNLYALYDIQVEVLEVQIPNINQKRQICLPLS